MDTYNFRPSNSALMLVDVKAKLSELWSHGFTLSLLMIASLTDIYASRTSLVVWSDP